MAKIAFNEDKELKCQGMYPFVGTWYGASYAPVERINEAITPRENLRKYW